MYSTLKSIPALLLMVGVCFSAKGKSIDVSTAQTAGSNFLAEKVQGVTGATDLTLAYTATGLANGATVNDYYVFNVNGGTGFVIIAGDDRIIPVLAYSGESAFDINHMSPSTKSWIEGYKNQITAAIANNIPAKAGTADAWSALETGVMHINAKTTATTAVAPLVTTKWDQDGGSTTYPYNKYCPNTSLSGGLSVTGCVSTAMAQLMKYWNWPTVGTGSHTYIDPSSGATVTADFGNTAYAWSTMPLTASNAAIATLMLHTGVSVNMSYTSSESGSYVIGLETAGVNCAEYALKTYFHYKPSLKGVPRYGEYGGSYKYYGGINSSDIDSIPQATWITMLQNELTAGRPMLYMGSGSDGGHCWICDGWETTSDMFHFNWGWSGESNGYFTVDDLAPPALGTGGGSGNFNSDQGVVMGVEPDSFPTNNNRLALAAHLNTTTSSPMPYGSPLSITTAITNTGSADFTGSLTAYVYDTAGIIVDTISTISGYTIAAGATSPAITFSCTGVYGAIPVTYHYIKVLYMPTGGTGAFIPAANTDSMINYTVLDVLNDTDIILYDSLTMGGTHTHVIPTGGTITASTTLWNAAGVATFSGVIKAVLINTSTGESYTLQQHTSQNIGDYGLKDETFTGTPVMPDGIYALEVQHQYGSTGNFFTTGSNFYANPILLYVGVPAPTVVTAGTDSTATTDTTTGVANVPQQANEVFVFPNPASDVINILLQGQPATAIRIMDVQGRTVKVIEGSNQMHIVLSAADFAPGSYLVTVQTAAGTTTKKIVISK